MCQVLSLQFSGIILAHWYIHARVLSKIYGLGEKSPVAELLSGVRWHAYTVMIIILLGRGGS